MNDDDLGARTQGEAHSAAQDLDEADLVVLAAVRSLYAGVDPVPGDLVERVRFALALDEIFSEIAEITRTSADSAAVRSEPVAETRTETLTFAAESMTAMVTVSRTDDGLRLDGWIAPPGAVEVRLRMHGGRRQVLADESGRFVFDHLDEGFAQLSFHPPSTDGPGGVIVTPLFGL